MISRVPKLFLLFMIITSSLFLMWSVVEANAICLNEMPPIFVMTDRDYYYDFNGEDDDAVLISGIVRADIIDENRYGNKIAVQIYDPNDVIIVSDFATLNLRNGSFVYNLPLWENDWEDSAYDMYTVKASYGLYQADFTFVLTNTMAGISSADVTTPQIRDVGGDNVTTHEIKVWQQVQISTVVKNNDRRQDLSIVTVLMIVNSKDEAVYIAVQSGLLKPDCSTNVGFSWMPEEIGQYEARVFAISDLTNPRVLSIVKSTEIMVTTDDL